MNKPYKVIDGPMEGAKTVGRTETKERAESLASKLNEINYRLGGPWAAGRYWVGYSLDVRP